MGDTFGYLGLILFHYYGWILFVWAFLYMFYHVWMENQQNKYMATIKWVFLEIRIDTLNEKSAAVMEHVFASLHGMSQSFSLGERWTGKKSLHFSAEIVSIGGRVSYIFKMPERYRNLLESALFAQYPKAEVREVQDYLANLPRTFTPGKSEFDFWGTQLIKRADNYLPIRTYRQSDEFFSHKDQDTTIEPLAGVLEAMSNILPHELLVLQLVMKPESEDWKKKAMNNVLKLKGLPVKAPAPGFVDKYVLGLPSLAVGTIAEALGAAAPAAKKEEKAAQSTVPSMTDAEKHNIDSIVLGLGKLSFTGKIRLMYLAPKDKLSKPMRIPEFLGAFRSFDSPQLNGFKPDARVTTDGNFKLWQKLEQPWLDYKTHMRKEKFLRAIKDRSHWAGSVNTILNTEEFATVYHFPQAPNARISQIEKVETVKSAPPIDLPIG